MRRSGWFRYLYMGLRTVATTRAKTSTSTWAAPARSKARAQASTVAPEVSTSSTSTSRRAGDFRPFARPATRNAPCTLSARSAFDRPTCCGVARTRLSAPCEHRDAARGRDRAGQRRRLIEAPRPQPPPMQRHRHERVGVGEQFAPGARHPAAHHRRKIEPVAIFEVHAPARGRRRRSAPPRGPGHRPADWRSPPSTAGRGRDRKTKGMPSRAQYGGSISDSFDQQARTEPSAVAERLAAGRAQRRQRDVERQAPTRRNAAAARTTGARIGETAEIIGMMTGYPRIERISTVHRCCIAVTDCLAIGERSAR